MPEPVLHVAGLTVGYGRHPVVTDASLAAAPGQIVALLGPNGAGKSTLLKGIFGLIERHAGSVHLAGRDLTHRRPDEIAGLGMSYVPQVENVFPSLTVEENLRMGAYLRPREAARRMEEVLALFPDLRTALRRRAGVLSGGQRNMLAMARGLMLRPQVLLLDEPTAGLAPLVAEQVWQKVEEVAATGTAVVIVEQNVLAALTHSHFAYVLVGGRHRYAGPSAEVARQDLGAMFLGR
jgi:ABC-type branched-subunit amino acid transport system ATPase component